jgi:hypothetical protein
MINCSMSLQFVVKELPGTEYAVYAVDAAQGNDAALLAVFNNPTSAVKLADMYTALAALSAAGARSPLLPQAVASTV